MRKNNFFTNQTNATFLQLTRIILVNKFNAVITAEKIIFSLIFILENA